jgi:hypothetical protein
MALVLQCVALMNTTVEASPERYRELSPSSLERCPTGVQRVRAAVHGLHVAMLTLGVLTLSPTAHALQPLDAFLTAAAASDDVAAAEAEADAARADGDTAWWKLSLSATFAGQYTHNQYPATITLPPPTAGGPPQSAPIVPANQWDASIGLTLPLVNVGVWGAARSPPTAAQP